MATGAPAVAKWVQKRLLAEVRKRMAELCRNADTVYAKMKSAGAALPSQSKWNDLSCEQKLAFITALGPYGAAMLAGGVLLGGWTRDAAGEAKKYVASAAKSLGSSAKSFADSAKNALSSTADKLNPFNGVPGDVVQVSGAEPAYQENRMRPVMDVDFGQLSFGAVSSPGGTQRRSLNGFGGLGATPAQQERASAVNQWLSTFDPAALINAATNAYSATRPAPQQRPAAPSPIIVQQGPAQSAPSAGMPSWVLPMVGLGLVGALAFSMSRRR